MDFSGFQELQRYVGWGERDAEALRNLLPHVTPHLRPIAEEFYEALQAHPDAVRVLRDEAQVLRLQQTLQRWLHELLQGPHDEAYLERRKRIGEVHARVGTPQRYVFGAMNLIRQRLGSIIQHSFKDEPDLQDRARRAVDRALDVELAIMLETFRESWMERIRRIDKLEREGISQRLTAAQERYRDAIESAQALILVLDGDEKPLLWNRMAAQVTGYDRDELLDQKPLEMLVPETSAIAKIRQVTPEGPATFEAPLRTRSGREHHVRWLVSATHDPELKTLIRYVIGIDLTDAHEAARRARNAERLAAVGTMAAGLAHEIRNPLNAASLHVTILERSLKQLAAPPAATEATAVLRDEIKRLSQLVTEFLDFARPKPLRKAEIMLCDLCTSVVDFLRPDADHAGVTLLFSRPQRPIWIKLDTERIRQVLINLIRNAIEATVGNPDPRVTLKLRRITSWAEIDVEDNGKGIPEGTPIFDVFYTTKEHGTGLGLSIVHRIVDDHGGSIGVRSEPGATTFTVRLPGAFYQNDELPRPPPPRDSSGRPRITRQRPRRAGRGPSRRERRASCWSCRP